MFELVSAVRDHNRIDVKKLPEMADLVGHPYKAQSFAYKFFLANYELCQVHCVTDASEPQQNVRPSRGREGDMAAPRANIAASCAGSRDSSTRQNGLSLDATRRNFLATMASPFAPLRFRVFKSHRTYVRRHPSKGSARREV